ncbi:ATP phosphoribosyltransferase [Sulfolobus acidocaldarius]|uniref:ATP phosphoribosyltransferase n=4 Tax=Sulfolobus acidocaldarius TaxID=2285 RepID=HIS1_SULAC|nr:ATP phosphoribosyltransferase [Sulfolobus acidocaldarius]Q4J8J2.1 RecName: Full=ATP phosphoribosyltransferase; Short=ATP-PRT; Short=ATP-PRTase [Sulfolobus acidocaldarius DSM 639]AAY80888.1 ATP phosphoribosyltransferase [Sulfolobus acidocaldarius DSM 639]AGE71488.1 ATP phosphoribosyltransferase [Sulfolobus acidocaldarius N8]AGE73761.1 ATP phosphoribosyltransferase [Sulfolobus acidocaldarius Ron12/I]ALU30279.1 ATP phosphoribosyltransferase [Sulfolobus acidocaldarius]ALU30996.1 ATP phosphorib
MKLAIPNKGRLQQPVLQFLNYVGIRPLSSDERALIIPTNWEGIQLVMLRTEDIPSLVEAGAADIGITGYDYVLESGANVDELIRLDFGKAKIVLAVPLSWDYNSPDQIKQEIRIATKYYNLAKKYITEKGIPAKVVKISGAAEVIPSLGAADAIIDVMSTGTTLKLHGLKPLDTVLETQAVVIGNRYWMKSDEADKINLMLTMMKGALYARNKKMIFMNVPDSKLNNVIQSLPAMLSPTLSKLAKGDAWEVITVIDGDKLPEIIAKVVANGARDIVVVDIEKVIK